ncbi:helix-turn-helix transcriptional regulator [Nocardia sp. BMG111209]|uniref:ArsR/SmtB family transcription factor n=1 Tax=Nocardia sp. BMG111209 TaxID=1160137 RepID=UPI0003644625|nr:metalloregulator ArsR/SmtB family transcription factor [Nocardia sp. BMG111209]
MPLAGARNIDGRREILGLLLGGERTVQAIAGRFDMTRPSISEHLRVLRDCGSVGEEKRGRFRYYRIEPEPLHELQSWLGPFERFRRQRLRAPDAVPDGLLDPGAGGTFSDGTEYDR